MLKEGKKTPRWHKFLRQFTDVLVIVLLLAAAVTALLEPREIDWMITAGTLAVFCYNLFWLERSLDLARTLTLTTMVFFQMWTAIASRSTTHTMVEIGWFSNKRLLLAIAVSIILMLPVIYVPILQDAFGTTALDWVEWAEIIAVSVFGLFAVETWEHVNRKYLHYGAAA